MWNNVNEHPPKPYVPVLIDYPGDPLDPIKKVSYDPKENCWREWGSPKKYEISDAEWWIPLPERRKE